MIRDTAFTRSVFLTCSSRSCFRPHLNLYRRTGIITLITFRSELSSALHFHPQLTPLVMMSARGAVRCCAECGAVLIPHAVLMRMSACRFRRSCRCARANSRAAESSARMRLSPKLTTSRRVTSLQIYLHIHNNNSNNLHINKCNWGKPQLNII